MRIRILPSLLAADVGRLEAEARRADESGGDGLHLDIMDGHFVPNLSMGPAVVAMAKRSVRMPLNVHLMMTRPDRYVDVFADAGADALLIHIEADVDVPAALRRIRERGMEPGIVLNPETPAEQIASVLGQVQHVLCMTVRPGYGGQAFMHGVLSKIRAVRDRLRSEGLPDVDLLVDGGVDETTLGLCAGAGANAFVAGTALYRLADMAAGIQRFRQLALDAWKG